MTFDALWADYLWPLLIIVIQSVALLVILLVSIAYILLADRKIWAAVQIRRGPNVVGPWGLLQSFADLLKFVLKEPVIPAGANKGVFLLAPLVSCVLALAAWAVIPVHPNWVISDINVGVLFIFAISSLSVYGIIMAGWASNSKYAFLSAVRIAPFIVAYSNPDPEKLSAYECGFDAFDDARLKFDVRFYLVAILFIIFDLEVAFLFPWAVAFGKLGATGFWSMMVFLAVLTIGFAYEWKKGALEWD